jgi:hypothetical protein
MYTISFLVYFFNSVPIIGTRCPHFVLLLTEGEFFSTKKAQDLTWAGRRTLMSSEMPQLKGIPWTKIPNPFLDSIITHLTGSETKILLCLFRHSIGYHLPYARLSFRRLSRISGLAKSTVERSVSSLEQKGYISRNCLPGENISTYWICFYRLKSIYLQQLKEKEASLQLYAWSGVSISPGSAFGRFESPNRRAPGIIISGPPEVDIPLRNSPVW